VTAETLTHCAACGRRLGKRPRLTIADWFRCGIPPAVSIVHFGCRHKPLHRYPRPVPDAESEGEPRQAIMAAVRAAGPAAGQPSLPVAPRVPRSVSTGDGGKGSKRK